MKRLEVMAGSQFIQEEGFGAEGENIGIGKRVVYHAHPGCLVDLELFCLRHI